MALSDAQMGAQVQAQLHEWWGEQVDSWGLLKVYRIPYAQPAQTPSELGASPVALGEGLYCVGDHRSSATLNGAISSGRLAAESILKSF
jgi:predicted NAD/FAD-dependent oxidoreductase